MLKRRAKISPNFSMASMTDLIFLLLIFFMITSTMVSPNAIKVLLPQGKQQTSAKPLTRVIIDKNLNYYAAFGNDKELSLTLEELTPFLQSCAEREPEMYIALYADETVPYREIVKVLNIANENKFKMVLATLVVHVAIIALLILVGFTPPEPSEEGGVPVMLGEVPDALGAADPSLVKVDVMPEETAPQVQETVEQDIITQETEETVAIKPKAEPKKKKEVKKPEKTEAEKAEEARKLAAAKAERERKEAEEAARKRVAGAFGKGAQMGSKGDTEGEGIQGSPTGNAPSGATSGTGGYGSFNLGGRSLGEGGLPRPVYNVQDEGRVVVTITVNPAGHVIATSINRQTNTVNPALRKAAEDAAKKARFNAVSSLNNQTGTITYYFNLK